MMNIGKKILLMRSTWNHKILKLPIVSDQEKYVGTPLQTNFIMVRQDHEQILLNGLKDSNYKVLYMESQPMLLILSNIESFSSSWRLPKDGPSCKVQLTSNGNASSYKQYSPHIP